MPTIGKIIIFISIIYIATVLSMIDYNDLSWQKNSYNYWKIIAGIIFIIIQFKLKNKKNDFTNF